MTRIRTSHIVVAAVAALVAVGGSASVALAAPPPPCLSCGSGGGGGGGSTSTGGGGGSTTTTTTGSTGGTNSTPTSHPTPPPVAALSTTATAPRVITVGWTLPKNQIVSGVVVRRGLAASCPTSTSDGVGIGGSAKRTSQVDKSVKAGGTYCYSVFTTTPYHSSAAAHHKAVVGPPAKVTGITAIAGQHSIKVRWNAAAGATGYLVTANVTGTRCPSATGPNTRAIKVPSGKTSVVDTAAVVGTTYCYAVFATNGTRFHSARGLSTHKAVALSAAPGTIGAPTPSSSSSMFSASLAKLVGGVAIAVLLLAALASSRRQADQSCPRGRLAVQPDLTSRRPDQHRPV